MQLYSSTSTQYEVSIDDRTINCLDFQIILDKLVESAITIQGKKIVMERKCDSQDDAILGFFPSF